MVSCIRIYIRCSAERTGEEGRGRGRNKRAPTSEENLDSRKRWLTRRERRYIYLHSIKRKKESKKERKKENKKERKKARKKGRKEERRKE